MIIGGLACFLAGIGWGYVSYRFELPPYRWARAVWASGRPTGDPMLAAPGPYIHYAESTRPAQQRGPQLETLGYLGAVNPATTSGVSVLDAADSFAGPRLLTLGSRPEAELVDPSGKVLHRWALDFEQSFPEQRELLENHRGTRLWRRVHLLEDGGLLAVFDYIGLVRLDVRSKKIWAVANGAHHAVTPSGRGTFYGLSAHWERIGWRDPSQDILHDHIVEIDENGRELARFSLMEALRDSAYAPLLERATGGDPLHTNTLQVIGKGAPGLPAPFQQGALLVSFRELDTIAVVDPEKRRVVWALSGMFRQQHEPRLLSNGRILLFDNLGDGGKSRVLELDPTSQRIHWEYDNTHGELFSRYCGLAQRLPNGNTLITETDEGRVIEVTPAHRTVWEYRTPHRQGDLVARVLEAQALAQAPVWIDEPPVSAIAPGFSRGN